MEFLDKNGLRTLWAQINNLVDSKSSGGGDITEISTEAVRITDLEAGIYRLTNAATKRVYYKGATDGSFFTLIAGLDVTLHVEKSTTPIWNFYAITGQGNSATEEPYLYYGACSTTTGDYHYIRLDDIFRSSYVRNNLTTTTNSAQYALSAYQGYLLNNRLKTLENASSGGGSSKPKITLSTNDAQSFTSDYGRTYYTWPNVGADIIDSVAAGEYDVTIYDQTSGGGYYYCPLTGTNMTWIGEKIPTGDISPSELVGWAFKAKESTTVLSFWRDEWDKQTHISLDDGTL